MSILFGPAGNSQEFVDAGCKSSTDSIRLVHEKGLDAFEYQCGRGVRVSEKSGLAVKKACEQYDVSLSIHAPYYISLASVDPEKRDNSINYILQSARAVKLMGGKRIVVHPGGLAKYTREEATGIAIETLKKAIDALKDEGLDDVIVCPETMGKINQLGNLEEVITFCKLSDNFIPCVDFGHLNSRTLGSLKTVDDFKNVVNQIADGIGEERAKKIHVHFSKIEYSKGGEVRHLTFEDNIFGPDYEPFLQCVSDLNMEPVIICESAGTQSQDSLTMKNYFFDFIKK